MENLKNRLEARGWTENDIRRIEESFNRAEMKKSPALKIADKLMFWLFILIITIGNFLLAMALIPILLSFSKGVVYLLLSLISVLFGVIFSILIHSFEFSRKKQYFSLITTIFFSVIFLLFVNNFAMHISNFVYKNRNPIFLIFAYLTAFITPYFIYHTFAYYHNKKLSYG
jgi:hypothetical protein